MHVGLSIRERVDEVENRFPLGTDLQQWRAFVRSPTAIKTNANPIYCALRRIRLIDKREMISLREGAYPSTGRATWDIRAFTAVKKCKGITLRTRTESKRKEILDIALRVFIESGFETASMSEIASRVGGSKTTLYGYFPSKETLFIEVLQDVAHGKIGPILDALPQKLDGDIRRVLIELGCALNDMATHPETDALAKIAFSQLGKPEFVQKFWEAGPKKMFDAVSAYLGALGGAGRLNVPQVRVATDHLLALYRAELGVPFRPRISAQPSRRELTKMATSAVDVFLAAYGR